MLSTIVYDDIFTSFLGNITDYEIANMDETDATELAMQLMKDAVAEPKVARLFSSISFDDTTQTVTCKLAGVKDDEKDYSSFVTLVIGLAMVCQWIEPKVQNTLDLNQLFTGQDQRFFAQSAHMAEKKEIKADAESKLDRTLKDFNATNNSYINGGSDA